LILLAVASLLPGSGGMIGGFRRMQEQFEKSGQADVAEQLDKLIQDPAALAMVLVFALAASFLFTSGFATLGGAMGARVLGRKD
jgi:hypothetical protein